LTRIFKTRTSGEKNAAPAVSFYERRRQRRTRSTIFSILLLVAILLALHFLNLFLQWTVTRLELARGPVFMSPEYTFLGFSLFNRKEIAAVGYFKNSSKPTRVFGFFDFYHPAIFAIWNKNNLAFIDLGPIVVAVPTGFSRIAFYSTSVFLLEHENKAALKYFGASLGGSLWYRFLAKKFNASRSVLQKPLAVSFVVKEVERSRYLKIPFLIYFYLPLLIIVLVAIRYGPVMLMAMFYYAEIFFLFDYREMFVTIPFDPFFKLFNLEISLGQVELVAAVMAVIFVLCAAFGLWHWKKNSMSGREKGIILFFILLPFFLFF
jgi:predicted nucleic acid-binding Zn ribbon protein